MAKSRVTGARETAAAFRELARLVAPAANQASVRSLRPTLAAARENAPVETGALRRSLAIKRDRKSSKTSPRFLVGPASDFKGPDGRRPAKYAHLIEFGRAPNENGEGGIAGTRWLTRAYLATREMVPQIFGREFGPAIERQAARIARQKAKRAAKRGR